jgi:hypothetical protein
MTTTAPEDLRDEVWHPVNPDVRQQVLVEYLLDSSLTSRVVAWAIYDGPAVSRDRRLPRATL